MKPLSNKKTLTLSLGLLGAAWCLIMVAVASLFAPTYFFGGGIVGGVISFLIAEVYLLFIRFPSHAQSVETGAVSIYFTIGFVAISAIINTLFILIGLGNFNRVLLAVNALIDVCFIIAAIYVEKYAIRVAAQLERTEKKIFVTTAISQTIGSMIAAAPDDTIRNKLMQMKETVDYSSNISADAFADLEQRFAAQLEEAQCMMEVCEDSAVILQKLQQAEQTWKQRNTVV